MQEKWQKDLKNVIKTNKELTNFANIEQKFTDTLQENPKFKLKAPQSFLTNVNIKNISDPLLLQVLPLKEELIEDEGYSDNPLQEDKFSKIPGLIHKYKSRVLLIITGACAIHCRYCFRREFPYNQNILSKANIYKALDYIKKDENINEVIFSGGDPLIANDEYLQEIAESIQKIQHIKSLRFHTRIPVVLPSRITDKFIKWVTNLKLNIVIVIHCNHPNELNNEAIKALKKISDNHITLLNQSVLLKNVNDNANTLKELSEKLFYEAKVMPYYIHMLDKVKGSKHFEVSVEKAKNIYKELQSMLPGYLVPKLAQEIPNKPNKTLI